MSNPLEAAIQEVSECVDDTGTDEERAAWVILKPILQEAAKVDKEVVQFHWRDQGCGCGADYMYECEICRKIRDLLESLPDAPEKEKP